jgi:hypothetical protein
MTLLATAANAAWFASCAPAYAAFRIALNDPRRAQLRLLNRYLHLSAETEFGKAHGLERVTDVHAFRRSVPVRDYDELEPWIDRIAAGHQRVLCSDTVTRLVPSSGSTRAAKLIPYTRELQREFNRAIGPWIADLYRASPALMRGCAYWSVSPVAQKPAQQENSLVPIGFDDDSEYLGGVQRRLIDAVMAVGNEVRHLQNIDDFRFESVRQLLTRPDLRLISVWHPSFLELLLDSACARWNELLLAIERKNPSRAADLRAVEPGDWHAIWPHLALISCWADANAAAPAHALKKRFPHLTLQPKGLLATEAFISIPFATRWPLAIRSHFFEFEDDDGRIFLADELQDGAEYGVIVTTGAGLWRYRLGDRVRCDGRLARTPSIRFIGRSDLVVDLRGEKLGEGFVGQTLRNVLAASAIHATFSMLAPDECDGQPVYTLFLSVDADSDMRHLPDALDRALRANPHYAYCRDLGQLHPPRLFLIRAGAYETYIAAARESGRRMGDIKPVALDRRCDWPQRFAGDYLAQDAVSTG